MIEEVPALRSSEEFYKSVTKLNAVPKADGLSSLCF